MRKLRIFSADDHVVLREGLALLIEAQPDMAVVGHAVGLGAASQARQQRGVRGRAALALRNAGESIW